MKKIFKFLLWLLGVTALLVLTVALVVPFFFDPNDHKADIVALAKKHTGRDLRIEGEMGLSVFPWLGLDLPEVEVGNAPGFPEPVFARLDEMQIRVKLLALITKRVEMDTVTVRGLELNLARREDGVTNWDDLVARGTAADEADEAEPGAIAALALGGLDIQGAAINWRDERRDGDDAHYAIAGLNIQTGPLDPSEPVDFEIAFDAQGTAAPVGGRIVTSGSLQLTADGNTVQGKNLALEAELVGDGLPGGKAKLDGRADAMYDIAAQRLQLTRLEVDGSNLVVAGRPGAITLKGTLDADLVKQVFELPGMTLAADLRGAGEGNSAAGGATQLTASGDVRADLAAQTLTVRSLEFSAPEINLAGASGQLSGNGEVSTNLGSQTYAVTGLVASGALSGDALQGKQVQFKLESGLGGNLAAGKHQARNLSLAAIVKGDDLPGGELTAALFADVEVEGNGEVITAKDLRLESGGLKASGTLFVHDAATDPSLQGTLKSDPFRPRQVMERFGIAPPVTADPKVLGTASINTAFAASRDAVKLDRTVIALDESRISGSLSLESLENPVPNFNVTVDRIDLDRYLPPPATPGGNQPVASPVASPGAAAAGAMTLPVDTLRALNGKGQFKAGRLRAGGMQLEDVRVVVNANGGLIKAAPLSASLYGGGYRGSITIDARGDKTRISIDEKLTGVRADKLMRDLKVNPGGMDLSGSSTVAIKGTATGDAKGEAFHIEGLALDARLAGKSFPGGELGFGARGKLDVDLAKQTLGSDSLELQVGDMVAKTNLRVTKLLDDPSYRGTLRAAPFNPRTVLRQLGQKDIVTADPKALASAALDASVNGTSSKVSVESLALTLDQSKLDGTLDVENFDNPAIRFDLHVDTLDADRYLPPPAKGKQAPAGTPGAALAVVPTEAIRDLDLNGQLRIDQLKLSNLRLSGIKVTATAKDGVVSLHPLDARLYQGTYTGNVGMDARGKQPVLRLDERLENVQAGPLLQDLRGEQPVTGTANVHAKLSATGSDAAAIKQSLTGTTRFDFTNGMVKGLDMIGQLCALASAISIKSGRKEDIIAGLLQLAAPQEAKMTDGTPFTDLGGTVNFANGVATNEDLVLASPVLDFGGRGKMDLTSLLVDYRGVARLSGSCADRVGRSFRELRGHEIPVHISGLVNKPKVDANLGSLIQAFDGGGQQQAVPQQQAPAQPQQPQQPQGVFGQGPQQPAQPAQGQQQGQQPQQPPSEEDVIRGLLQQLIK